MGNLLTVRQLQEQLQVDRMTIYRMLDSGRLTGVKVGGQWRFREEDLQHLISSPSGPKGLSPSRQPALPLPCLQAMQQLFSEAVDVAAIIVDPQGEPLTDLTKDSDFCSLILASDAGRRRCVDLWAILAAGADSAPHLRRCHAGLLCARASIFVESRPLAAVIAGGVLSDTDPVEGEPERLEALAAVYGIPLHQLQEAYVTIRRLDRPSMDRMLHLLKILGVAACRIGSERQRLVAKLDRIAEITSEG